MYKRIGFSKYYLIRYYTSRAKTSHNKFRFRICRVGKGQFDIALPFGWWLVWGYNY